MTAAPLTRPPVSTDEEVVESSKRIDAGMVVHGVQKFLAAAPGATVQMLPSEAKKLVAGWASFVHGMNRVEADTKQAIIAAFAREGIVSKGKDGWMGKPCPTCKGHQFVESETSLTGERTCGACGGTGEWYIPSLDEREETHQGDCRPCDGEGVWRDDDGENLCRQCDGTGKMSEV